MGPRPVGDDVHVFDRARSTAEVLVDFYRTIHDAATDGSCWAATSSGIWPPAWCTHSGPVTTCPGISVDPATRSDAVDTDLSSALRLALDGGGRGGVEPVDWLHNPTPATWRSGSETRTYTWYEDAGADPYDLTDAEPGG